MHTTDTQFAVKESRCQDECQTAQGADTPSVAATPCLRLECAVDKTKNSQLQQRRVSALVWQTPPFNTTRLSAQSSSFSLQTLLQALGQGEEACESLSLTHPLGILGIIVEQQPTAAQALLASRLQSINEDVNNWWGITSNKRTARETVERMQGLLEEENLSMLVEELIDFERDHGKVPFHVVLHHRFVGDYQDDPITPIRIDNWQCATAPNNFSVEPDSCEALPAPADWSDSAALLATLIGASPGTVLLALQRTNRHSLLEVWKTRLTQNRDDPLLKQYATRQKQLAGLSADAPSVSRFLEHSDQADIRSAIEQDLAKHYFDVRFRQLMRTELADQSTTALNGLEDSVDAMIAANTPESTLGKPSQFEELRLLKRALRLIRFMNLEKDRPQQERLYQLATPSTRGLMDSLRTGQNDTEMALCRAIESHLKSLRKFQQDPGYQSVVDLQRTEYRLRLAQEERVMAETRALVSAKPLSFTLAEKSYSQNIELLRSMDRMLDETTPVSPLQSKTEAVVELGYKIFWPDRRPLGDRLTELQHLKDLQTCQYSFTSEAERLVRDVPGVLPDLAGRLSAVVRPAVDQLQAWREGRGSAWSLIAGVGESTRALEEQTCTVLGGLLHVAERNPRLFRRMVGDCAQTLSQLEILVGSGGAGLLSQLQRRAQAESAASCFAGDTPVIEEFDYQKHPQEAELLRRFQFLADFSDCALKGTTAINALVQLTTDTPSSRVGNVIGLTAGAAIGGIPGAAIGYRVGGMLGAAFGAATHVVGTAAVRQGVNRLDQRDVRQLNMLVNYGPAFALATNPIDELALIARGVAKREGVVSSILSACLRPWTLRVGKLREAIKAAVHREAGWSGKLAMEGFKCLVILGGTAAATSLVAGGAFYVGLTGVALLPLSGSGMGVLFTLVTSSQVIARFVNHLEQLNSVFRSAWDYYSILLPEHSVERRRIEAYCAESAKKLLDRMGEQSAWQQYLREATTAELAHCLWDSWAVAEPNQALVASFSQGIDAELAETATARRQLAEEIEKHQRALVILKAYRDRSQALKSDQALFERFRQSLLELGMTPPDIARGIGYYIQDQLTELPLVIVRQCGTDNPGDTAELIENRLEQNQRRITQGYYLNRLAAQGHPVRAVIQRGKTVLKTLGAGDFAAIKIRSTVRVNESVREQLTDAAKERMKLCVNIAAAQVEQTVSGPNGNDLVNPEAIRRLLGDRIIEQGEEIREVETLRVARFKQRLESSPLFQNMSREQRQLLCDQAILTEG